MSLRPSGGDCTITLDGSRVFLESVAANRHYICTTSMNNGAVDRGRAGAKTLAPFLPGDTDGRTQASGIKLDGDRLLVSGGYTARFFIYTDSGKLVSSCSVPRTGKKTLVNDETVVQRRRVRHGLISPRSPPDPCHRGERGSDWCPPHPPSGRRPAALRRRPIHRKRHRCRR
jgi:hypothetical protein